jgi:hypothetical protein
MLSIQDEGVLPEPLIKVRAQLSELVDSLYQGSKTL